MEACIFRKGLVSGVIVLFLLTSLSPVYAGYSFSESTSIKDKTAETTMVENRDPFDGESFLDKYDSLEIKERYRSNPHLLRHDQHNPIRKPTIVDGEEWNIVVPDDYPTIQDAINNADETSRILVRSGIYEENVVIDVDLLTLHGEDKDTTIIDGSGSDNVIKVKRLAGGTNISGFTIHNSGIGYAGVNISSRYNTIINNIIIDNGDGIQLNRSSGNLIQDNQIINNEGDGLWLHRSHANNITGNIINDNGDNGIEFNFSSLGTSFDDNEVSEHSKCGIYLDGSSLGNMFTRCFIINNDFGAKCVGVSDGNIFQRNAFVKNTINAFDSSLDQWDFSDMGNYWDDYDGVDADGDGIGDTPYNISGGENQDRYPLMNPALLRENDFKKDIILKENNFSGYGKLITTAGTNEEWNIIVPDDYPTIQEAIDQAAVGYRILVREGVYRENIVVDTSFLTLHGEDKNTTVIDGGVIGRVITATKNANGFNISGFTIQSRYRLFAGLYFFSDYSLVEDNILKNCNIGVVLRENTNCHITSNRFSDDNYGVWTWMCTNSTIEDNIIENNRLDGVVTQHSTDIFTRGNDIEDNFYNGILQIRCSSSLIQSNGVSNNGENGIQIFNSNNGTFENNEIIQNGYELLSEGIQFYKSTYMVIKDNVIRNNRDNGIHFCFYCNNNIISENTISNNGWHGISCVCFISNKIINNSITSNENYGIALYFQSNNNTISGNTVSNNGNGGIFFGLYWSYCKNNSIVDNTISSNIGFGIRFNDGCSKNKIIDNKITSNGGLNLYDDAICLDTNCYSNKIIGNDISLTKNMGIFLVNNCDNNTISNNTIHSNKDDSICLQDDCDNNYIANNSLESNDDTGLVLSYNSDNNFISRNTIKFNKKTGIYFFWHCSNNKIINNTISSNSWDGVLFISGCNGNMIENNAINSNGDDGIDFWKNCNNNIITDNNIYSNDDGIYVWGLVCQGNIISYNTIFLNGRDGIYFGIGGRSNHVSFNNFLNNFENAYDGGNNFWNNEANTCGNYWDDYTGTDGDGDGIGDTPYIIPGLNNQDNCPLMNLSINIAPFKPMKPLGPSSGKPGNEYVYSSRATDPNGDQVYFEWDWGDGTDSGWLGPYDSGEILEVGHKWRNKGSFNIRVKAKDVYDYESEWSDPLEVSMPKPKSISSHFNDFLEIILNHFPLANRFLRFFWLNFNWYPAKEPYDIGG